MQGKILKREIPNLYLIAAILAVMVLVLCVSCGPKRVEEREPIRSWVAERDQLLEEASGLSVQELVDRLGQVGDNIRIAALIELGNRDPGDVVPLIIQGMQYYDDYSVLMKIWGVEALPVLTGILKEPLAAPSGINEQTMAVDMMQIYPQMVIIYSAARGLGLIGPAAVNAAPFLLEKMAELRGLGISHQFYIYDALASIGCSSPEVIEALLNILKDDNIINGNGYVCYALGDLAEPGNEEVIAALVHYVDMVNQFHGSLFSTDELAARVALYKLGWEKEGNFRILSDFSLLGPSSQLMALGHIGNEDSNAVINDYIMENPPDNTPDTYPLMSVLSWIGPNPDVKQYMARVLCLPPMEDDIRPQAFYYLGKFGAESRDMLPTMIDFYEYYQKTGIGEEFASDLILMHDAILRVYEGL